ncbi:MAG TPA: hypothetical protein VIK86_02150 [Candidatus Paceibacterota bacterium]
MSEKKARLAQASELNQQISQIDCMMISILQEKLEQQTTLNSLQCLKNDLSIQLDSDHEENIQFMFSYCVETTPRIIARILALDSDYQQFSFMKNSLIQDFKNIMELKENNEKEVVA